MTLIPKTSLEPRKERTKEGKLSEIIIFPLEDVERHYQENIEYIQKQFTISDSLIQEGKLDDAKYIWRSQVVMLGSAFDYFMHEITWFGLESIFNSNWNGTEQFEKLEIPIKYLAKSDYNLRYGSGFKNFITDKLSSETMLGRKGIDKYLTLIGISFKEVAKRAFYERGSSDKPKDKMENFINDFYHRRNLIAHQSDRSERDAKLTEISKEDVETYISQFKKIVEVTIHLCKQKLIEPEEEIIR